MNVAMIFETILGRLLCKETEHANSDHLRMIGKNDSDHISYHFYTVFPIALLVTGRCRCTKCAFCAMFNGGLKVF